jgi:glycosyltransferase involved in cell wall biosynthesis
MRIVAATVYGTIGGSTKVLLAAAEALRSDHTVVVRAPLQQADSVMPRPLPSDSLETVLQKIKIIPRLVSTFAAELFWVRNNRPDVLYVHDELSLYVYGAIGKVCRLPVIWHVHMREGAGLARRLRDRLCNAKIFVSRFMVGDGQRKRWIVIRNAVEPPACLESKPRQPFTVGMIGSISKIKNQQLGIRVIAELRNSGTPARLLIYGDTLDAEYRTKVEGLIRQLALDEMVVLRGFVPLQEALSEIDVLLACSTYESFGLATVETLGSGLPVVASDIESHREIAAVLQTDALVLTPLQPAAMASAIMAVKPDKNAPQRVAAEFGAARFAAAIREFFRSSVEAAGGQMIAFDRPKQLGF